MPTVTHIIDQNLPVYATGNQTISGEKIFKNRIGIGETLYDFGFSNSESPATLQLVDYGNSELRLGGVTSDHKKTISFYDDSLVNFQIVNDAGTDFENLHISGKENRKVNFNNRPTVNGTGVLLQGEAATPDTLEFVNSILLRRFTVSFPSGNQGAWNVPFGGSPYLLPPRIHTTILTRVESPYLYVSNIRQITTSGLSLFVRQINVTEAIPETGLRIEFLVIP
jgi:hypothetical protein